jgi:hypothetical protein
MRRQSIGSVLESVLYYKMVVFPYGIGDKSSSVYVVEPNLLGGEDFAQDSQVE